MEARVRSAAEALGHGIEEHEWSFPIHFQEMPAGADMELGPVRIRAFATHHSPEANPHGLIVTAGNQRIAYSGDTGWFDALPGEIAGSDLFLCECTQVNRSYEYHLSLEELAETRPVFDCGRLVLTHLGEDMRSLNDYGPFEVADDGLVIKL